jgi:hypothetical protein
MSSKAYFKRVLLCNVSEKAVVSIEEGIKVHLIKESPLQLPTRHSQHVDCR